MATRWASSVRTTRRSPPPRTPSADVSAGGGGGGGESTSEMRKGIPASAPAAAPEMSVAATSGTGGGGADEEEPQAAEGFTGFSFQELAAPPTVDGAEILDVFVGSEEARKAKAVAKFLEATMGANTVPRTEAIKSELVANGRVLDLAGFERWMRGASASPAAPRSCRGRLLRRRGAAMDGVWFLAGVGMEWGKRKMFPGIFLLRWKFRGYCCSGRLFGG